MGINSDFLNQNVDKEFETMQKATQKHVTYAHSFKPHFSCNCSLCGTTKEVECLRFGHNLTNTVNVLYVCPVCKKWFGDYLITNKADDMKDIEE